MSMHMCALELSAGFPYSQYLSYASMYVSLCVHVILCSCSPYARRAVYMQLGGLTLYAMNVVHTLPVCKACTELCFLCTQHE